MFAFVLHVHVCVRVHVHVHVHVLVYFKSNSIVYICRFYLIVRMIYMFVFHGVEEDIRSDNEEEDGPAASTAVAAASNGHHDGKGGKDVGNGRPPAYDGQKRKTS